MNYPKPKTLSTAAEPHSPKYIAVPQYKHKIERQPREGYIFDDIDSSGFLDDSVGGLSKGLKTALIIGAGILVAGLLVNYLSKKRRR